MKILARIPRTPVTRFLVLLVLYGCTLFTTRWLAYQLRFDFNVPDDAQGQLDSHWYWVIPFELGILFLFGQFSGLLSYFSVPDFIRLLNANIVTYGLLLGFRYFANGFYSPPRGVILLNFVLSVAALTGVRMGLRLIRERYLTPQSRPGGRAKRVGIVGAGDVGASLVRELFMKRGLGLQPVVFFDDDKTKWKSRIHDVPVIGPPESILDQKLNMALEEVIIAMPSASAKRIGEVVRILQRARLGFATVPSMEQLATGQIRVSQLRAVEIQDLLGREAVPLNTENIRGILANRCVMVTGAGGSIGSELCRQIASFNPQRLLLVDQSEVQLFPIEQELMNSGFGGIILPLIANIRDTERMHFIFRRFQPAVVFHAAAHKHVPMMESQPGEAIRNNTLGTARLAELAQDYGVERFVMISTDKAINPTNVMGATKRLAETFIQALHSSQTGKTKFMAVRFGNVLGSSGSVIPIFNKQIAAGGPVKVTHPDVTRYFMTISEAAGLVLQSGALGLGGEIFVLDMGKPVKIVDLARQLIELSGLKPDDDIEIVFTGLRPGEKLFEELSYQAENLNPTEHQKILRLLSHPQPLKEVRKQIEVLEAHLHNAESNQLKLLLKEMVPEYQPYLV